MKTISYKCQNCGGGLRFEPKTQGYQCEYCNSLFNQKEIDAMYVAPDSGEAAVGEPESLTAYNCPSCGAEIVTDESTAAIECYYCHNPVVMTGKMKGANQPDLVAPFKIDKAQATQMFETWISKKKFIPTGFYSKRKITELSGVYYPFYLYSCAVDGELTAKGKKYKTWRQGDVEYTQTDTYQIERKGSMQIYNVMRNALSKEEGRLPELVFPFDIDEMCDFKTGYLSGFIAENQDVNKMSLEKGIHDEVQGFSYDKMRESMAGFQGIHPMKQQFNIHNDQWQCALFPVWVLTYKQGEDRYTFTLNGQNGQIAGNLPIDKKKVLKLFLCLYIPLFILLLGGSILR